MRHAAVVLAVLLTLSCGVSAGTRAPATPAGAGDPAPAVKSIVLKVGQSAPLADTGLKLEFESVKGDSRCPVDVQCIQAGDALVVVSIRSGQDKADRYELYTPARADGSNAAQRGDWVVEIQKLEPAPHSTRPIAPGDYVATFVIRSN